MPSKYRLVQVQQTGKRKLFGKERKALFLEWFAATCNVRLSAGKAGVSEKTVYKHLLNDPAFEEAFGQALRLGYARLEARMLQEAHRDAGGEDSESLQVRGEVSDAEAEKHFDPQLGLQLLREHARRLPGVVVAKKNGFLPRPVSEDEIASALAKRLKSFAARHLRRSGDGGAND